MIELFILKKAKLITVRNKESFDYLSNNGINDVILTTDTAHTILTTITLKKYSQILNTSNKKKLLFHYTKSYAFDIILPVLNDFLSNHPEFDVVLSTDQFYNDYSFLELEAKKIVRSNVYVYKYEDPIELCSLIKECNLLITSKLHVGIVGATYGKAIVSFPIHKEKIIRFYKQLGEDNRVLPLDLFDNNKASQILENYHNKAISIDNTILELSYKNLTFLTDYISSL